MAKRKLTTPATLASHFGIAPKTLDGLGVLNPTLAVDTKLFIDPMLLQYSAHPEMHGEAIEQFNTHFSKLAALLEHLDDAKPNSAAWRAARQLVVSREVPGTCLGYGAAGIHGSAVGPDLADKIIRTGREIVDLGVKDPLLFTAMGLFEEDMGPDRISDLTTTAIRESLVTFNKRILGKLKLKGDKHTIVDVEGVFLTNPFSAGTPIVLVPSDILRELPVAKDWYGVARAARHNEALRSRVNRHLGHLFQKVSRQERAELRAQALSSAAAFTTLLEAMRKVSGSYDLSADPSGLLAWASVGVKFAERFPIKGLKNPTSSDELRALVSTIVDQFRFLVEHRGLNKELFDKNGHPRHEQSAQRFFFAVAYSYCKAHNLDITPEAESGNGPVDFKVSKGFDSRVLVEIKLSTNSKTVNGYRKQLDAYKNSEETQHAIYLVVDVGQMGDKRKSLEKLRAAVLKTGQRASELQFVDGLLQPSASKR